MSVPAANLNKAISKSIVRMSSYLINLIDLVDCIMARTGGLACIDASAPPHYP